MGSYGIFLAGTTMRTQAIRLHYQLSLGVWRVNRWERLARLLLDKMNGLNFSIINGGLYDVHFHWRLKCRGTLGAPMHAVIHRGK